MDTRPDFTFDEWVLYVFDNPPNYRWFDLLGDMWWDLFPAWGQPDDPHNAEIDDELLKIMQRILWLDSDACRESALHGLGHWARRYPDRVMAIVDEFLDAHPQLRPELRRYANSACAGCIQ